MAILVIGPRELPGTGMVEVSFDVGSGWAMQRVLVPVKWLTRWEHDPGEGATALYEYESSHHRQG